MKNKLLLLPLGLAILGFVSLNSANSTAISTLSQSSIIDGEYHSEAILSDTSKKGKKTTNAGTNKPNASKTTPAKHKEEKPLELIEDATEGETGSGTGIGSGGSVSGADTMTLIK